MCAFYSASQNPAHRRSPPKGSGEASEGIPSGHAFGTSDKKRDIPLLPKRDFTFWRGDMKLLDKRTRYTFHPYACAIALNTSLITCSPESPFVMMTTPSGISTERTM
jgi:hypothetical protein